MSQRKINISCGLILGLLGILIVAAFMLCGAPAQGQITQPATQPSTQPTTQPEVWPANPYSAQLGNIGQQFDNLLTSKNTQIAALQAEAEYLSAQLAATQKAIEPGTDLGPIIAKATAGQTILLKAFATYPLTGGPSNYVNNVRVIGWHSHIIETPVPGGSSGIAMHGDGWHFNGLDFSATTNSTLAFHLWGTDPALRTAPPQGTRIIACSFDKTIAVGMQLDTWADNCTVDGCAFDITLAQGIYCTADNLSVLHCTFAGSVGEHDLRIDVNGTTKHRPQNLLVAYCAFANHNIYGKECCANREVVGALYWHDSFDGWYQAGQGNTDTNMHASGIVLIGCTWLSLRPGGALAQFEHNTDVIAIDCTMPGSLTDAALSIGTAGVIYHLNLQWTKVMNPANSPAPVYKPFIAGKGTDVDLKLPAPTTQPAAQSAPATTKA